MKVFCQHCTRVGRSKTLIKYLFSNPCDLGCRYSRLNQKQGILFLQPLLAVVWLTKLQTDVQFIEQLGGTLLSDLVIVCQDLDQTRTIEITKKRTMHFGKSCLNQWNYLPVNSGVVVIMFLNTAVPLEMFAPSLRVRFRACAYSHTASLR